jgi:Uma2 family endonuclease
MTQRLEKQKPVSSPAPLFFDSGNRWRIQEQPNLNQTRQPDIDDFDDLVTEDDEPVDNIFSEKQQRLLTESLYNGWKPEQSFLTLANVGLFYALNKPPLVPDVLLSLEVKMPEEVWKKRHRSYFISEYGKPPEVVIEIVSNQIGNEADTKWQEYAKAGVRYYVILDPQRQLKKGVLRLYELQGKTFVEKKDRWLEGVGLGLTLWKGRFEDKQDEWLRWCNKNGDLILTGYEKAKQVEREKEQVQQRADSLAAKLRSLGFDPDQL